MILLFFLVCSWSQLMDINESPVYVLLNPAINHAHKDLPVTIYESGMFSITYSYGFLDILPSLHLYPLK